MAADVLWGNPVLKQKSRGGEEEEGEEEGEEGDNSPVGRVDDEGDESAEGEEEGEKRSVFPPAKAKGKTLNPKKIAAQASSAPPCRPLSPSSDPPLLDAVDAYWGDPLCPACVDVWLPPRVHNARKRKRRRLFVLRLDDGCSLLRSYAEVSKAISPPQTAPRGSARLSSMERQRRAICWTLLSAARGERRAETDRGLGGSVRIREGFGGEGFVFCSGWVQVQVQFRYVFGFAFDSDGCTFGGFVFGMVELD